MQTHWSGNLAFGWGSPPLCNHSVCMYTPKKAHSLVPITTPRRPLKISGHVWRDQSSRPSACLTTQAMNDVVIMLSWWRGGHCCEHLNWHCSGHARGCLFEIPPASSRECAQHVSSPWAMWSLDSWQPSCQDTITMVVRSAPDFKKHSEHRIGPISCP